VLHDVRDGCKLLSEVESISNLAIYHVDVCDFEAEGGIEPISDVAVFEDVEVLPYPVEIYDGTLAGEFAERCTKGNHIAKELFIEAFLTVLGAVVGDRLYGDLRGMDHGSTRLLSHHRNQVKTLRLMQLLSCLVLLKILTNKPSTPLGNQLSITLG
jgi:hypothetical protein